MSKACRLMLTLTLLLWLAPAVQALPLWELQGSSNTIRILGSIHFLRAEDYPLPQAIGKAYQLADVVIMELDLDDLNPLEVPLLVQRLALDPKGRDLEKLLGRRDFEAARKGVTAMQIDMAGLKAYEPWYAALQITQLRLVQLGFDPSYGIESKIVGLAAQDGKEIRGLETIEQQLGTLDALPPAAQRDFLMQTIDEAAEIGADLDGILTAWRRGDVATLEKDLLAGLAEQPELYDRILVQRNRHWAKEIGQITHDRQNYLIVVGTLHLVGKDSLLAMLQAQGYPSRQIQE